MLTVLLAPVSTRAVAQGFLSARNRLGFHAHVASVYTPTRATRSSAQLAVHGQVTVVDGWVYVTCCKDNNKYNKSEADLLIIITI